MRAEIETLVRKPTGALLVTGPTGSGKSTTLYAVLSEINRPEINVITVEDPVEYRLAGIQQVQMNVKAQLTFASALRTILRSDPDVIMVGEIRDVETAKISIESALTGHLVLSTLHTNDAPSALTRLNEMGVEPFLTGSAVTAVLAQRLARKLCVQCREAYLPSPEELVAARFTEEQIAALDGSPHLPQEGLRALHPDGLPRPYRRLPAHGDDGGDRAAGVHPGQTATRSAAPPPRRACARSGKTASRR